MAKGEVGGSEEDNGDCKRKATVGGERGGVPEFIQGRECRLDSALTISGTGATEDWSQNSGEWPRPKWTWESSRKPSAQTKSTPASPLGTASLLWKRRANTAVEWPCSNGRHRFLRWKPCASLAPTSSASSWRRERGGGTSLDVTSPPTTPR